MNHKQINPTTEKNIHARVNIFQKEIYSIKRYDL